MFTGVNTWALPCSAEPQTENCPPFLMGRLEAWRALKPTGQGCVRDRISLVSRSGRHHAQQWANRSCVPSNV
jgi:hypothetical protein